MSENAFLIALIALLAISAAIILAFLSALLWEFIQLARQLRRILARIEKTGEELSRDLLELRARMKEGELKLRTLWKNAAAFVKNAAGMRHRK